MPVTVIGTHEMAPCCHQHCALIIWPLRSGACAIPPRRKNCFLRDSSAQAGKIISIETGHDERREGNYSTPGRGRFTPMGERTRLLRAQKRVLRLHETRSGKLTNQPMTSARRRCRFKNPRAMFCHSVWAIAEFVIWELLRRKIIACKRIETGQSHRRGLHIWATFFFKKRKETWFVGSYEMVVEREKRETREFLPGRETYIDASIRGGHQSAGLRNGSGASVGRAATPSKRWVGLFCPSCRALPAERPVLRWGPGRIVPVERTRPFCRH